MHVDMVRKSCLQLEFSHFSRRGALNTNESLDTTATACRYYCHLAAAITATAPAAALRVATLTAAPAAALRVSTPAAALRVSTPAAALRVATPAVATPLLLLPLLLPQAPATVTTAGPALEDMKVVHYVLESSRRR
jgi:hypothetical protein